MNTPINSPSTAKPWLAHYPPGVPHDIDFSNPQTLVQMFNKTVADFPDNIALHFMGKDIPYKHLDKFTRRFAVRLSQMGVKKGDRVILLMPNCPQIIIAYLAVNMLSAIAVPSNPRYTERELGYRIKNSGAEIVVSLDFFYPKVKQVPEGLIRDIVVTRLREFFPGVKSFFYPIVYPLKLKSDLKKAEARKQDCLVHQDEACALEAQKEEEKLREKLGWIDDSRRELRKKAKKVRFFKSMVFGKVAQGDWDEVAGHFPKPADTADMLFTSGTTGIPKGAERTHYNLWASTRQILAWFHDAKPGQEVFLGVSPIFHTFGITTMNLCIALGGKLVLVPEANDILSVIDAIENQKPTVITCVPKLFLALVKRYKGQDWGFIRRSISGGAKLDVSIIGPFEKITGGKLVEGYGETETPVTHCNPLDGLVKPGSIGVPLPGVNARIMVKDGSGQYHEARIGEKGEHWVSGPQIMKGYFNSPEETANVFVADASGAIWLKTGDIAFMDEDGYFFIKGRGKEMILGDNGENIYPLEIEEVLKLHPAVLEAKVVGIPIGGNEEKELATAFVILQKGCFATSEEIIAHCKQNLVYYAIPKKVIFRTELPTTLKGDIIGHLLREEELAKRAAKE